MCSYCDKTPTISGDLYPYYLYIVLNINCLSNLGPIRYLGFFRLKGSLTVAAFKERKNKKKIGPTRDSAGFGDPRCGLGLVHE